MRRPSPKGIKERGKATFPRERPKVAAMRRPSPKGIKERGEATFP
jgi:hypothetical protein